MEWQQSYSWPGDLKAVAGTVQILEYMHGIAYNSH